MMVWKLKFMLIKCFFWCSFIQRSFIMAPKLPDCTGEQTVPH